MRVIFALVARMSAISLMSIGAANAQQQTKPPLTQFTPQQQELLKQLTPEQQQRLKKFTPQQMQQLKHRMELWERYRGWSMDAKGFSVYDHCMRTTGKWTYRC
jgi:Spy/CpxP family protein refolding chaperone